MFKRGVYFGREGWIIGVLHIVVKKTGRVDSRSVALYKRWYKRYILGGRSGFWEGRK